MNKHFQQADKGALLWLMSGLTLGAIPHFSYQPVWVMLAFVSMMSWRVLHEFKSVPLPSSQHKTLKLLHTLIAFVLLALLFVSYGTTIGRDAGIALLTVMVAMKVVELQSRRDFYVSVYLGYFLVITNFFHDQSIPVLATMIIVVVLMTTSLISSNQTDSNTTPSKPFKLAGQMLLQATPIMLLLFVLFPRIPGPLWGLPQDAQTASTGLSDDLQLGNISQLVQSDEIAFRVHFNDKAPAKSVLYWRGPVLSQTDGRRWQQSKLSSGEPVIEAKGQRYAYTLTLEPHNQHWLLALDMPDSRPEGFSSTVNPAGVLLKKQAIKNRLQYQLSATPDYVFNRYKKPDPVELTLPEHAHPKTKLLAQHWREQVKTNQDYIQLVLKNFHNDNFVYTLSPPPSQGDVIDHFLFESKQGFCEHYAASFTVLMRSVGIPARIVTGYLGGEMNPVDHTLIIRQRDAHAWSEVWLKDRGWVRIDPTAAIANERIEQGIASLLPAGRLSPLLLSQSDALTAIWKNLKYNWDAITTAWDEWVLAYGPEKQKQFLALLGMHHPDWQQMAIWLLSSLAAVILILSGGLLYRRRRLEPLQRNYLVFCHKLEKVGIHKKESEGPQQFANRAAMQFPTHAQTIQAITQLYIQQRYQSQPIDLSQLHRMVKQFRPRNT